MRDVEIGTKRVKDLTDKLQKEGFEIAPFENEKKILYEDKPILLYGKDRIVTFNHLESFPKKRTSKLKEIFREFGLEKYISI